MFYGTNGQSRTNELLRCLAGLAMLFDMLSASMFATLGTPADVTPGNGGSAPMSGLIGLPQTQHVPGKTESDVIDIENHHLAIPKDQLTS